MAVLTFTTASNNAELILQCKELGYLHDDWAIIDPTYGLGKFWTLWCPRHLIATDLDPTKNPSRFPPVDFTAMPYGTGIVPAVVFDPPYKLNGTSTGKGASASDANYGVDGKYVRWQDRHQLIRDGITECLRVTNDYLLVKCQDQVCSGKKRWQTREFAAHAEDHGAELVDMLHLGGYRKQPEGRRQVHSQQNYSTMLILRKIAP